MAFAGHCFTLGGQFGEAGPKSEGLNVQGDPMKLVVMIPAYNEEKTIGDVVSRVPRQMAGFTSVDVLVINDRSTDRTAELARQAGATVVSLVRRNGLGVVFRTGIQRAIRRGASVIVNIDGDGQFAPEDIETLIDPIRAGNADFVTCTRFADPDNLPDMPRVKYMGNQMVVWLINRICGSHARFTDVSCGFRAFSREAAYRLTLFGNFTYTQEVFIDLFRKGMRIHEVPLKVRGQREHGKSRVASNVLTYGIHSLMIMLRTVRDVKPLKFFGAIGSILLLLGTGCGSFLFAWWLSTGRTSPFTSLVAVSGVLVTLAFLLLVLGLLADMIGRHRQISEELLYLARKRAYAGSLKKVDSKVVTETDDASAAADADEVVVVAELE